MHRTAEESGSSDVWAWVRSPEGIASLLLAGIVFAISTSFFSAYRHNVCDDSLISFRYAQNLVKGRGLVFNPGEKVEGYTNFLWVMMLAPLYAVTELLETDFVRAASSLSRILASVNIVLLGYLIHRLWPGRRVALVGGLALVALDNAYAVWAMQALETHLEIGLILLGLNLMCWRSEHRAWVLGVVGAAVVMTRPDGALFCVAMVLGGLAAPAWRAWRANSLGPLRKGIVEGLKTTTTFAAVFGPYFAWRWSYYGYPLPNTYYVKLGAEEIDAAKRGLDHVHTFLAQRLFLPPVFVLTGAMGLRSHPPVIAGSVLWTLLHTAYVVHIGGDFYAGHRFLVVLVPMFGLGLAAGIVAGGKVLRKLPKQFFPACQWASAVSLVLLVLAWGWRGLQQGPYQGEILRWGRGVNGGHELGKWLGEYVEPNAIIATGDIGNVGFYTDRRVIDRYGIIHPEVAHQQPHRLGRGKAGHEKTLGLKEMLAQEPDFIKPGYWHADFYGHGYFLNTDGPGHGRYGLWERDPLAGHGVVLEEGRFSFGAEPTGWMLWGHAFEPWEARGTRRGQTSVFGAQGPYLSSFHARHGDLAVGRALSPPFVLRGDWYVVNVGGGEDPDRLRVSLKIGDQIIHSATGRETESLGRRQWNIVPWKGETARLEIVDATTGAWGHILVDEAFQWAKEPPPPQESSAVDPSNFGIPPHRIYSSPLPPSSRDLSAIRASSTGDGPERHVCFGW